MNDGEYERMIDCDLDRFGRLVDSRSHHVERCGRCSFSAFLIQVQKGFVEHF